MWMEATVLLLMEIYWRLVSVNSDISWTTMCLVHTILKMETASTVDTSVNS